MPYSHFTTKIFFLYKNRPSQAKFLHKGRSLSGSACEVGYSALPQSLHCLLRKQRLTAVLHSLTQITPIKNPPPKKKSRRTRQNRTQREIPDRSLNHGRQKITADLFIKFNKFLQVFKPCFCCFFVPVEQYFSPFWELACK